ncbi:hypothetical protein fh0823_17470 [Francisella halioticida]|nr:hypothetical protein fh0823_17470 [Francisella halioticida]
MFVGEIEVDESYFGNTREGKGVDGKVKSDALLSITGEKVKLSRASVLKLFD